MDDLDLFEQMYDSHPLTSYTSSHYVAAIQRIRESKLLKPGDVVAPSPKHINLGTIMINLGPQADQLSEKFRKTVEKTLESLLLFSSGTPIHFVIVTDKQSLNGVKTFLSEFVSEQVILLKQKQAQLS